MHTHKRNRITAQLGDKRNKFEKEEKQSKYNHLENIKQFITLGRISEIKYNKIAIYLFQSTDICPDGTLTGHICIVSAYHILPTDISLPSITNDL